MSVNWQDSRTMTLERRYAQLCAGRNTWLWLAHFMPTTFAFAKLDEVTQQMLRVNDLLHPEEKMPTEDEFAEFNEYDDMT